MYQTDKFWIHGNNNNYFISAVKKQLSIQVPGTSWLSHVSNVSFVMTVKIMIDKLCPCGLVCWTAKWDVQGSNPSQAQIWIEISVPCTPLLHLWDHKSVDTRASPKPGTRLEWGREDRGMGADTLIAKKKHKRNPMTQEQKRKPKNIKTWKGRRRKNHWTLMGYVSMG